MSKEASNSVSIAPTIHALQLHDVFLKKVEAQRFPIENTDGSFKTGLEVDAACRVENEGFEIEMALSITFPDAEQQPFLLKLNVVGVGISTNNEISGEKLQSFASTSGIYLLMPYARLYTAMLVQFMGLPPLQLPLLSIPSVFTNPKPE